MESFPPAPPGSLVSINGQGVLISGPAGVGKSSLALALIDRGHQLVADDGPRFERCGDKVVGFCPPDFQGKLLVTGLGPLDLNQLYGPAALVEQVPLALLVALMPTLNLTGSQELLEGKRNHQAVLGVSVPQWHLGAKCVSQLALLLEVEMCRQVVGHIGQ
jgi:HPr kinase/phosphorylase